MVENKDKSFTAVNSTTTSGKFDRKESEFRNFIAKDSEKYPAESGRYHLYISYACPWANRCEAVRVMKGLEDCIDLTVVHPVWQRTKPDEDQHAGWFFGEAGVKGTNQLGHGSFSYDDIRPDPNMGCKNVRELYEKCNSERPPYSVPILFDTKTNTIVNNESSEIIVMLHNEFNDFAKNPSVSLLPKEHEGAMKEADEWIYHQINNGVYKNGFAKTQEAYEDANRNLFEGLDKLDQILSKSKFIVGD
mmetsp:Transcript_37768/g.27474  ORF Transcript_37768/g.27474 Transcript_37768/m.27474 type:complete len:247 (-) Transcript_37768:327-1067(-)